MIPWILISIAVLLAILVILAIVVKMNTKKKHRKTDYYSWFIIGIVWLCAGVPLKNYALSVIGLVFMVLGLTHKKEWKKNRVRWSDLDDQERKARIWIMVVLGLLVLVGLAIFLFGTRL